MEKFEESGDGGPRCRCGHIRTSLEDLMDVLDSIEDTVRCPKMLDEWKQNAALDSVSDDEPCCSTRNCDKMDVNQPIFDPCHTTKMENGQRKVTSASKSKRKTNPKWKGNPKRKLKPGPVTNNPYLNFLRDFRRRYCGLDAKQLVILGAHEWRCLSDKEKIRYKRQACVVAKNERKNRRTTCPEK